MELADSASVVVLGFYLVLVLIVSYFGLTFNLPCNSLRLLLLHSTYTPLRIPEPGPPLIEAHPSNFGRLYTISMKSVNLLRMK